MHVFGEHHTYIIDAVFIENVSCLFLTNVNTRKLYMRCFNLIIVQGKRYKKEDSRGITTEYIISTIQRLIHESFEIKHMCVIKMLASETNLEIFVL